MCLYACDGKHHPAGRPTDTTLVPPGGHEETSKHPAADIVGSSKEASCELLDPHQHRPLPSPGLPLHFRLPVRETEGQVQDREQDDQDPGRQTMGRLGRTDFLATPGGTNAVELSSCQVAVVPHVHSQSGITVPDHYAVNDVRRWLEAGGMPWLANRSR